MIFVLFSGLFSKVIDSILSYFNDRYGYRFPGLKKENKDTNILVFV